MSRKISSDDQVAKRRVPAPYHGIQVNFCKSPVCDNCNVPPQDETRIRGRSATPDTRYSIRGLAVGETGFKCKACGEILPAKSNCGIYCELQRISAYLTPHEPGCPNAQTTDAVLNRMASATTRMGPAVTATRDFAARRVERRSLLARRPVSSANRMKTSLCSGF